MERSPRNILVLSLKFLGDVIAATPALRALDESFPDAVITVAIHAGYEEALAGNPHIDAVVSVGNAHKTFWGEIKTVIALRKKKFDMVIAMEPGDRESLWAFFSGAKTRIAPAYQQLEFLWNVRVPIREKSIGYIDYYNKIAEAAGAKAGSRRTEIFVSAEAAQWAEDFLKNVQPKNGILIGMHPGAREASRRWPSQRFAELIDLLSAGGGAHIILMCGKGERHLLDEIISLSESSMHITLAPDLSIRQTAALMQRCALCITNDSAPRHIAAAVGTRTVSTIPTSNVIAWSLYDPAEHPLLVGDDADPESLVKSVGAQDVYDAVEKLLPQPDVGSVSV